MRKGLRWIFLIFRMFVGTLLVFFMITTCKKDSLDPNNTTDDNIILTDSSQFIIESKGGV